MTKKYKNILFDMDGVLINSMKYHVKAWHLAFKEYDINISEDRFKLMAGVTPRETVERMNLEKNLNLSALDIDKIIATKYVKFDEVYRLEIFDNVLSKLNELKKCGYRLGLVSGGRKDMVLMTINECFPNIFETIVTAGDVKFGKPNPEPYQMAVDTLGLDVSETVVVEDGICGIESGNAAKLDVFALTTTVSVDKLGLATKIFESHDDLFAEFLN